MPRFVGVCEGERLFFTVNAVQAKKKKDFVHFAFVSNTGAGKKEGAVVCRCLLFKKITYPGKS